MKHFPNNVRVTHRGLWVLGFLFLVNSCFGQVVIGQPRITDSSAAPNSAGASPTGAPGSLSNIKSALGKQGPLAQFGPIAIRPYTNYTIQYGDGFLRVPGEPTNSTRQTLALGLLSEVGSTWSVDGAVTRSMYSSRSLEDTYDSSLRVSGNWALDSWTFGVTQAFLANSPIVAETGGQNDERTTRTSLDASYLLSDKTRMEASASWLQRLADPKFRNASWTGSDWEQTTISTWINYQFTSKVNAAVGFLAGRDDIALADDMTYTQPQVRISWKMTNKLSLGASGGIERRKVEVIGGRNEKNPVYSANISYAPTLTTSLSIGVSRNISNSYFNNQTIAGTHINTNISQRVLQRFFLSAGYSRGESEYSATSGNPFAGRVDSFESFNSGLSTTFSARGSVSITYSYSNNSSDNLGFGFSSRQVGADISYRF